MLTFALCSLAVVVAGVAVYLNLRGRLSGVAEAR